MYNIYNTDTNSVVWSCSPPDSFLQNGELKFNYVELITKTEDPPTGLYPYQTLESYFEPCFESGLYLKKWRVLQEIPKEIPLWAFRSVLTLSGLNTQVETLINSLNEPLKTIANIQWQYGNYIERNHELIESLGSMINLTSQDIDNIFIQASRLK